MTNRGQARSEQLAAHARGRRVDDAAKKSPLFAGPFFRGELNSESVLHCSDCCSPTFRIEKRICFASILLCEFLGHCELTAMWREKDVARHLFEPRKSSLKILRQLRV